MAAPTTCGHGGRTAAIHLDGRYCDWCYRNAPQFRRPCVRCTEVDHLNGARLCRRCRASDILDAVFTDSILRAQPALSAVRDHFRDADPRYVLLVKRRGTSWQLIEKIAALDRSVTHTDLDQMGTPRSVSQVRSLLVDLQVLPPRDEYAVAVEANAREELASLPHRADQLALRRFFRWQQQRRAASPLTLSMAANDRTELRAIGSLLRALNVEGFTIATGEQRVLDTWARDTPTAFRARRFLLWCARSGINRHLTPPPARPSTFRLGGRLNGDNEAALARVLVDDDISPRMRLAVLLTTVYAIRAHRIATLRCDALRLSGSRRPFVRLGAVDAELPAAAAPWVEAIVRGMPARRRLGGADIDETWVFPGYRHGSHMLPSSLLANLKALGVEPTTAHQASAGALISQLPPAVVARLIGVDIKTASAWHAMAASIPEHR